MATVSSDIPNFPWTLTKENESEVARNVAAALRPDWDPLTTVVEKPSVGFLNLVLICYSDDNRHPHDALVLKNFHDAFCGPIQSCKNTFSFLQKQKLGTKILAFLENGICIEYVDGERFDWDSPRCYDKDFMEKVADEVALWHSQKILEEAKKHNIRQASISCCNYLKYWDQIFESEPFIKYKNEYPSRQELTDIIQKLQNQLSDLDELTETFVHLDLTSPNIILNTANNPRGIQLLDYDFSGIGYVQQDLASFFRLFKEVTEPGSDHVPGKDYEMKFLSRYLKRRNELDGKKEPDAQEVEKLYKQVQKCKVFCHIRVMVISTFILYFNARNTMPAVVDSSSEGTWRFVSVATNMWRNYSEYVNRMLQKYE